MTRPNNALHLTPPLPVPVRHRSAVQALPVSYAVGPLHISGCVTKGGEETTMCRKEQFACFSCRKMFRQPARHDMAQPIGKEEKRIVPCPQCGQFMTNMGKYFKTPRQADVKQWQKVQELSAHGFLFGSSGTPRPATLQEVKPFLAEQKRLKVERGRQAKIQQRAIELSQRRNKRARLLQEKRVTKVIQATA